MLSPTSLRLASWRIPAAWYGAINAEMCREYEGEATRINVARLREALYSLGGTRGELRHEVINYIERDAYKLGWDCQLNAERTEWVCIPTDTQVPHLLRRLRERG